MKIFKIVSIGIIMFLSLWGGKAAESTDETPANSLKKTYEQFTENRNYMGGGFTPPAVPKELEIAKKELNAGNLNRFLLEVKDFIQRTIEFRFHHEEFDYTNEGLEGTIEIKPEFDFAPIFEGFQQIVEYLQEAIKGVRPETAEQDSSLVFFEPTDRTISFSRNYKKGLFGFVKIIEEKQINPIATLLSADNGIKFLDLGKEIKDYIKEYKA